MINKDQLVKIHTNIESLLVSKQNALPKDFNKTRFLQNCITVLQDTPDIEKVEPKSIARTMLKGAFLGLDFFNKECYAIPYNKNIGTKDKPIWVKELQFQTDYKGEIKVTRKYSFNKIKDIYAKLVRDGDHFSESVQSGRQIIEFTPKTFNNGKIKGAFAVCLYEDGTMIYETMSTEEVEHVRDTYSKMATGKAWKESFGEMMKKTVLRRLCKFIQTDFDNIEQAQTYEDSGDFEFKGEVEAEYAEVIPMPKEIQEPKKTKKKESEQKESPEVLKSKLEKIDKIKTMILKMADSDSEQAKAKLLEFTTFETDDETVIGVKTTKELEKFSSKRVMVTYGKVKKEYETMFPEEVKSEQTEIV